MDAPPQATEDSPETAAQLAEMRRNWNNRLGVNLLAIVGFVAYFTYPTWGRADFGSTMLQVLPVAAAVTALMVAVNRWFVARQTRQIREAAAGVRRG